jgi:hypothetical protein
MTVRTQRKGKFRVVLAAALTALVVPAVTAITVPSAVAQAPAAMQGKAGAVHARPDHTEGRIAFLKAELKITDAQAQAWDGVASAMRQGAAARTALREEMRGRGDQPMTAVDRLAFRDKAMAIHADNGKAFTAAFKTLYAQLSDEQKKAADQLLSRHHRHRA